MMKFDTTILTAIRRSIGHAINYNNRQLFEGLFDFFFNFEAALRAYGWAPELQSVPNLKTLLYATIGFLTRLALFPLTSTIYTFSRIFFVVLNPAQYMSNLNKSIMMLSSLTMVGIAALTPSFAATLYNTQVYVSLATAFGAGSGLGALGATAVGGLLMGAFFMMGLAITLHSVKKLAQFINSRDAVHAKMVVPVTSSKYILSLDHETFVGADKDYLKAYNTFLKKYYNEIKRPAIYGVPHEVLAFKDTLHQFADVNEAFRQNQLTQKQFGNLIASAQNTCEHFKSMKDPKATLENLEVENGQTFRYKPKP